MYKISDELLVKIKDLLISQPLDIYSHNSETINEANFELVDSRYEENSLEEEARYIGSANMFIAASLACYVHFNCREIDDLSDEELTEFAQVWSGILEILKEQRYIREIGLLAKEKIKVVVDNTKLP